MFLRVRVAVICSIMKHTTTAALLGLFGLAGLVWRDGKITIPGISKTL
jgi:hypothetical protein